MQLPSVLFNFRKKYWEILSGLSSWIAILRVQMDLGMIQTKTLLVRSLLLLLDCNVYNSHMIAACCTASNYEWDLSFLASWLSSWISFCGQLDGWNVLTNTSSAPGLSSCPHHSHWGARANQVSKIRVSSEAYLQAISTKAHLFLTPA